MIRLPVTIDFLHSAFAVSALPPPPPPPLPSPPAARHLFRVSPMGGSIPLQNFSSVGRAWPVPALVFPTGSLIMTASASAARPVVITISTFLLIPALPPASLVLLALLIMAIQFMTAALSLEEEMEEEEAFPRSSTIPRLSMLMFPCACRILKLAALPRCRRRLQLFTTQGILGSDSGGSSTIWNTSEECTRGEHKIGWKGRSCPIKDEYSVGLSVCEVHGIFTQKLRLPARNGGQQQGSLIICTENIQLWHLFLATGDTSDTFEIYHRGLIGLEISILGSNKN
jgi:hypothetical protein